MVKRVITKRFEPPTLLKLATTHQTYTQGLKCRLNHRKEKRKKID